MSEHDDTKPAGGAVGGFLGLWAVLFLTWMAIASDPAGDVALLGLAVSGVLAAWFVRAGSVWRQVRWSWPTLKAFIAFLGVFLSELVRANLTMLRIVGAPQIAIAPGVVRVRTRLRSPLGRMVLANAIALTPGSLVLGYEGEILYVHWLNVETTDIDAATARIVAPFEPYLEVIFG